MPRYDLPDAELIAYRSAVPVPRDLGGFWTRTLTEARELAWNPKTEQVDAGLSAVDIFDVTFSGFGGEPVRAWLRRPATARGDLPAVVRYPGYGGGRGLPHQVDPWPLAGYASL